MVNKMTRKSLLLSTACCKRCVQTLFVNMYLADEKASYYLYIMCEKKGFSFCIVLFVLCSFFVPLASPKVLTFDNKNENRAFHFVLCSFFVPLASPKVLTFDNKNENRAFHFVLCSLNRTFAPKLKVKSK